MQRSGLGEKMNCKGWEVRGTSYGEEQERNRQRNAHGKCFPKTTGLENREAEFHEF